MNDEEILALFFARSELAIDALRQTYGKTALQLAQNILPDPGTAEECLDDALLAAWNAIPPARPERLGAWFFRVVRNQALRRRRSDTAQKRMSSFDAALDELSERLPDPGTVEQTVDARELAAHLDRFLNTLDGVSRVLFLRRYWYADPPEAIAHSMGMTRNAVTVRLHRIRNKLKAYLIKEGYDL